VKLRTGAFISVCGALALLAPAAFAHDEPTPKPEKTDKADETPASTGPTVTLGTAPSKDTPQAEEKKEEKKDENQLFWKGTNLYAQTSMSTTTIAPQQQLTQASTVESWFRFLPVVAVGKDLKKFTFTGWFTLDYEWTDTAATGTTTRNEPQFGDSLIFADWAGVPEIPKLKIKVKPGIAIQLPTSKISIAKTLIMSPGLRLGLSRSFEKIGGNEDIHADLGAISTLSRPLYAYTTGQVMTAYPYAPNCFGGVSCVDQGASGAESIETSLGFLFLASASWKKVTLGSFFRWGNGWKYHPKDVPGVPHIANPTVFTQSTYFNLALSYDITKWVTAEVGYYLFRPQLLNGDGHIGNPFFDPLQDMRLYLRRP